MALIADELSAYINNVVMFHQARRQVPVPKAGRFGAVGYQVEDPTWTLKDLDYLLNDVPASRWSAQLESQHGPCRTDFGPS